MKAKRMISFSLSMMGIAYLFGRIAVTSRKAPTFLRGLFSSSSVGAEEEIRTPDPLLGNSIKVVSHRLRITIALRLRAA